MTEKLPLPEGERVGERAYRWQLTLLQHVDVYILIYMQQVIVELDDRTIARLNRVAPPSARKRSEFIREAIRRALNERLEQDMERAYRKQPQESADVDVDPATWEAAPRKKKARR